MINPYGPTREKDILKSHVLDSERLSNFPKVIQLMTAVKPRAVWAQNLSFWLWYTSPFTLPPLSEKKQTGARTETWSQQCNHSLGKPWENVAPRLQTKHLPPQRSLIIEACFFLPNCHSAEPTRTANQLVCTGTAVPVGKMLKYIHTCWQIASVLMSSAWAPTPWWFRSPYGNPGASPDPTTPGLMPGPAWGLQVPLQRRGLVNVGSIPVHTTFHHLGILLWILSSLGNCWSERASSASPRPLE